MAILISDNFNLNSKQYIDKRVNNGNSGYTLEQLKNWEKDDTLNIPDGFEVWVNDQENNIKSWYTYNTSNEESETTGKFRIRTSNANINDGSIPIYASGTVENMIDKPDEYIEFDDSIDEITNVLNSKTTNIYDSNLSILFNTINTLKLEVERLKASFQYGINSYTGKQTASSDILYDLDDVEEQEPLWAVQESELDPLFLLEVDNPELTELVKKDDTTIISGDTGYLTISGSAEFNTDNIISDNVSIPLSSVTNNKSFFFINSSDISIDITLSDYSGNTTLFNIKDLVSKLTERDSKSYSTLLCVSKMITDPITLSGYGKSFIWLVVQDLITNNNYFEKYINPENLTIFYDNEFLLKKNYYVSNISFNNLKLSRLRIATKYQDFSDSVEPVAPSQTDSIKYKAAHITIRSVDTVSDLEDIKKQLLDNELVFVEDEKRLYIISNGEKYKIGSNSSESSNNNDNNEKTMAAKDLLNNLKESGIITINGDSDKIYDESGNTTSAITSIELNKIGSFTIINENNNEEFTYTIDSNGNLVSSKETASADTFATKIADNSHSLASDTNFSQNRGFIARSLGDTNAKKTGDAAMGSDRVKIGSFYMPSIDQEVFGCSHAFIELENTSDNDYYLDGCYLHFAGGIKGTSNGEEVIKQATYHLPLKGKLPKGGTFLIRGCKYAEEDLPTTYINVDNFDMEWYVSEDNVDIVDANDATFDSYNKLIDIRYYNSSLIYGFALTYGQPNIQYNTQLIDNVKDPTDTYTLDLTLWSPVRGYLIDSANYFLTGTTGVYYWGYAFGKVIKTTFVQNSIFKNTFELDPAKQAFQSYTTKDSSRLRGANNADFQTVQLDEEYIQFPHSNDVYPVSMFTPKTSFEGKNVSTDKTKIDAEKPNMVTCSFGIDTYKTRCFNWISIGEHNEYIWLREKGKDTWEASFSSYWDESNNSIISSESDVTYAKKDYSAKISWGEAENPEETTIREIAYANSKYKNVFPGCNVYYKSHKCIVDITKDDNSVATNSPITFEYVVGRKNNVDNTPMEGHCSDVMEFTIYPNTYTPKIYQVTDQQGFHWIEYQAWAASAIKINEEIENDLFTEKNVSGCTVTGEDFIVNYPDDFYEEISKEFVIKSYGSKTTIDGLTIKNVTYKDGNYYTISAITTPNVGLTLVQVDVTCKLTYKAYSGIMPILINTGDMTQNGTRINEWLDYYNAGKPLFTHLEQMNVVGNNDLGNIDETILGTGDDNGKSNPHFYNIAYCYEMPLDDNIYQPIILGISGTAPMYIPSLYYFITKDFMILMINSEITKAASVYLFNNSNYDVYTGYELNNNSDSTIGFNELNSMKINDIEKNHYIYEIIYNWLNNNKDKKVIAACHEMPFTVITQSNLLTKYAYADRSISVDETLGASTGLIGSHCNKPFFDKKSDTNLHNSFPIRNKGTYWLSRLFEYFNVKYCIGGHKHTYSCTWPLREYYYYDYLKVSGTSLTEGVTYYSYDSENGYVEVENPTVENIGLYYTKGDYNSLNNGIMEMMPTLKYDNPYFFLLDNSPIKNGTTVTNASASYQTTVYNTTKTPIMSQDNYIKATSSAYTGSEEQYLESCISGNSDNCVLYFMLQATGFKLKSNKELPSTIQRFSQIIPISTDTGTKPGKEQIFPMFAEMILNAESYDSGVNFIKLMAIKNIVPNDTSKVFNQQTAIKDSTQITYFDNSSYPYGKVSISEKTYTVKAWQTENKFLNLNF